MNEKYKLIPRITFWVLFALCLVFVVAYMVLILMTGEEKLVEAGNLYSILGDNSGFFQFLFSGKMAAFNNIDVTSLTAEQLGDLENLGIKLNEDPAMNNYGVAVLAYLFVSQYLVWTYILAGLTALAAIASLVMQLVYLFQKDLKKAIILLLVAICYLVVVPMICYSFASGDFVEITGYEGTDNVGRWARISEAVLYWVYFAIISTLLAMGWGAVHRIIKGK